MEKNNICFEKIGCYNGCSIIFKCEGSFVTTIGMGKADTWKHRVGTGWPQAEDKGMYQVGQDEATIWVLLGSLISSVEKNQIFSLLVYFTELVPSGFSQKGHNF